jgi:predicted dehydrogenase
MQSIRVGIIGAHVGSEGATESWGMRAHIPALRALPDFDPVAVATASEATAREAATVCGIPHAFGDARQLVELPEVDLVAICVRVPRHLELVAMALAAGKHVYCEWPLGRNTAEGIQLAAAAHSAGVCHTVGLQGRRSPAIEYVRDLIAAGEIGQVRACSLNHSVPWPTHPPPHGAYLQTIESGANFLTIPVGHSIDTVTDLLGPFEKLTAVSEIQEPHLAIRGTNEPLRRTAPDQIAIVGLLAGGVVASLRFQGASRHGTGIRLEINGERGDLVVAPVSPRANMLQIGDLALYRSNGLGSLESMPVPERYFDVPLEIRSGPPLNVARAYLALGRAIRGSESASPDFAAAVALHRTLDAVASCPLDETTDRFGILDSKP